MSVLEQYVSIQEAADALSVSTRTVRRAISSGELPSIRLGSRVVRVPASALEQLAAAGDRSVSAEVRRALARHVARSPEQPTTPQEHE